MKKVFTLLLALLAFHLVYSQTTITTFPYIESFENFAPAGNPIDWTTCKPNPSASSWRKNTLMTFVHSGKSSVTHGAALNEDEWLISPKIALPANETCLLAFWTINDWVFDEGTNSVWISDGSANPADGAFKPLWTTSDLKKVWQETAVALTDYVGKEVYIAFRYQGNASHEVYLDDVSISFIPAKDAGVTAITYPINKAGMTAAEKVKIKVKNFGTQTITALPVKLEVNGTPVATETIQQQINSMQEIEYTFQMPANLSAIQTHPLKACTVLPGDSNTKNDTTTIQVIHYENCDRITNFPFFESFETDKVYDCWKLYDADGVVSTSDDGQWIPRTYAAHSGKRSMVHPGYYPPEQDGWLVMPQFVLADDAIYKLSFWSNNWHNSEYGKNSVLISTKSYDPLSGDFEEIWSPDAVTWSWEETVLDLSGYAGKEIYIAFRYEGMGHNWCLDDVSVIKLADKDVGVTAIKSPVSGTNLASETVTITVHNYSSRSQSNIPVQVLVNGRQAATGTVPGPVAPESETDYDFPVKVDFSAVQKYTLVASAELSGDENSANNADTVYVTNYGTGIISSFPYSESFENPDDLFIWKQDKPEENIKWTFTSQLEGNSGILPHSGNKLAEFYVFIGRGSAKLITPQLNLNALQAPVLRFWYATPSFYGMNDHFKVYYKNSANGNWKELFAQQGIVDSWKEVVLQLPEPSADYYIAFEGDAYTGNGVLLDDMTIGNAFDKDVELKAIVSPVNGANLGQETVKITLKNMGIQTLTSIPVKYSLSGKTVSETISGLNLKTFEEYTYAFQTPADLLIPGTYPIEASTELPGDNYPDNDYKTIEVVNYGNIAVMGSESSFTTCDIRFMDDGVDRNYKSPVSNSETQIITFLPAEAGKRMQVAFNRYAAVPFEISSGLILLPDTLIIYEGSVANENNRIVALTGDLNNNLPAPFISHSPDGALTFVFKKVSGLSAEGWDAAISCVTPISNDLGVRKIIAPLKGGDATAQVKVLLKNYGANPVSSFDVGYNDVVEPFTGTIPPGETAEYTFTRTLDVSAIKEDHILRAYTLLSNDADRSNDTVSVVFAYRQDVTLYGYRLFDSNYNFPNGAGWVSFGSNNPETIISFDKYMEKNTNLGVAGEMAGDYLYLYTANRNTQNAANFVKLDKNRQEVETHSITAYPMDMAYDHATHTMFAISYDQNNPEYQWLNEVNLATGALIPIGPFQGNFFEVIACSKEGQLYGIGIDGTFCSIDKYSGAITGIAETSVFPAQYMQSMAFDHNTGRLFWAAMDIFGSGRLIEINPATGATTNSGIIGGSAEIVALYTPYSGTKIKAPATSETFRMYPNPAKEWIILTSVPEQSVVRIMDLSGRTLQTHTGLSGKVQLNLNLRSGIYFVQIENKTGKTTQKLIVK